MRIKDYKLPPFMRYVTLRIGRRPLNMFLWYGWMLVSVILIYGHEGATDGLHAASGFYRVAIIAIIGAVIYTLMFARIVARKEGREWLLREYHDDGASEITLVSCAAIRAAPLIALIIIFELWLLHI